MENYISPLSKQLSAVRIGSVIQKIALYIDLWN